MKQLPTPTQMDLPLPYDPTDKANIREGILAELYALLPEIIDDYQSSIKEAEGKEKAAIIHNLFDRLGVKDGYAHEVDSSDSARVVTAALKGLAEVLAVGGLRPANAQYNPESRPEDLPKPRDVTPSKPTGSPDPSDPPSLSDVYAHFQESP